MLRSVYVDGVILLWAFSVEKWRSRFDEVGNPTNL